jgi:DNA-binding NtrC family response regulator
LHSRIVVVHDDTEFLEQTSIALDRSGYGVTSFTDPTAAFVFLMTQDHIEMLLTRVHFGPRKRNGITMALMASEKHRSLQVIFTSLPSQAVHALHFGEFLPMPVSIPRLMDLVKRLLPPSSPERSTHPRDFSM